MEPAHFRILLCSANMGLEASVDIPNISSGPPVYAANDLICWAISSAPYAYFQAKERGKDRKGDYERQHGAMGRDPMTGKLKLGPKVWLKEENEQNEEVRCV